MATLSAKEISHDNSSPTMNRILLVSGAILALFILIAVMLSWMFTQGCDLSAGSGGPIRILLIPVAGVPLTILGGLIMVYKPHNRIGWLCLWMGFSSIITPVDILIVCGVDGTINVAGLHYLAWGIYSFGAFAVLPLHVLFPAIFPTGHFLSPFWRRLTIIGLVLIGIAGLLEGLSPDFTRMTSSGTSYALSNPFGMAWLTDEIFSVIQTINITLIVGLTLASIASLILRFRRSSGDERQQIKWLVYFFVMVGSIQPVIELIGFMGFTAVWDSPFYLIALVALFGGFPIVTGITIFKYRLYDIDIIINRTLVYGGLTLLVVGLYVLVVNGLGLFLQSQNTLPSSVIATALITLIFQPARNRLQGAVNRLMFGERDNPYAVLSLLSQQVQTTAEPSATLNSIVGTIAKSLKLPYVAIELLEGDHQIGYAKFGEQRTAMTELPLRYQNEFVGRLQLALRAGDDDFTPQEQQLFSDIAAQIAPVASATRLTMALQHSREQLVLAREEERRRIRRDLHDGLGPTLASQTLQLDAVLDMLLENDASTASEQVKNLKGQTKQMVADIRRLVYELRPPALDELGLLEALRAHVLQMDNASNFQITIQALPDPLPVLPAAIEVAAYRIVLEAVTNVIRHADANTCQVQFVVSGDGQLSKVELSVTDDGTGLPEQLQSGVGLTSMRERASELGGTFALQSGQNGGTQLAVVLPFVSKG